MTWSVRGEVTLLWLRPSEQRAPPARKLWRHLERSWHKTLLELSCQVQVAFQAGETSHACSLEAWPQGGSRDHASVKLLRSRFVLGLAVRQVNAPHSQISISLTLCIRLSGPATSESQFLSPIIRDPSCCVWGTFRLHFQDNWFLTRWARDEI